MLELPFGRLNMKVSNHNGWRLPCYQQNDTARYKPGCGEPPKEHVSAVGQWPCSSFSLLHTRFDCSSSEQFQDARARTRSTCDGSGLFCDRAGGTVLLPERWQGQLRHGLQPKRAGFCLLLRQSGLSVKRTLCIRPPRPCQSASASRDMYRRKLEVWKLSTPLPR